MTKRERTIALIVGAAAGYYLLDSVLITPQLAARTLLISQVEAAKAELGRDRNLVDRKAVIEDQWQKNMQQGLRTDPLVAIEQVANHLNQWATEQELTIGVLQTNSSPQPVNKPGGKQGEREPGFMKVSCQYAVTGRMAQIANFLKSIQEAQIPIRISDLRISTKEEGTDNQEMALTVSTIILKSEQTATGGARAPAPTTRSTGSPTSVPTSRRLGGPT